VGAALTDSNLNEDPRIADARWLLKALEAGKLTIDEPGPPSLAVQFAKDLSWRCHVAESRRNKPQTFDSSSRRGSFAPRLHRRRPEGSVRSR
jgi:hypothetical protein